MYFCDFCLGFFRSKTEINRHAERCKIKHPPGNELYRDYVPSIDKTVSLFEVDGKTNSAYCENLCYLSKLFLDHKNLSYNTEIFLFMILCETDEYGSHIVGKRR